MILALTIVDHYPLRAELFNGVATVVTANGEHVAYLASNSLEQAERIAACLNALYSVATADLAHIAGKNPDDRAARLRALAITAIDAAEKLDQGDTL